MAVPARPRLAVIVVSYRVPQLLRACLAATYQSLARSPDLDATVYVVENASGDESAALVATEFPQARLYRSDRNLGFAGGNNLVLRALGFESSGGASLERLPELVLLLNPDAEPQGDAIGELARFLLEHPAAGGAGARLQYPDGRFQHGAFAFPGLWQLLFDLFPPRPARLLETRLNGRYARSLYAGDRPFPVDFPLGAALMARREAIQAAGLLDEGYFMYAEEVDWCWRMRKKGWRFYCVPAVLVVHHGGASTRQFRARSFADLWRSRQRLYARFYGPARRWLAAVLIRAGMQREAARARGDALAGRIAPAECEQRVAAAGEVAALFSRRSATGPARGGSGSGGAG